jgi:hypothetical protein
MIKSNSTTIKAEVQHVFIQLGKLA